MTVLHLLISISTTFVFLTLVLRINALPLTLFEGGDYQDRCLSLLSKYENAPENANAKYKNIHSTTLSCFDLVQFYSAHSTDAAGNF